MCPVYLLVIALLSSVIARPSSSGGDDALFLTPYIENGQIEDGQRLAAVKPMLGNIESFAGYLTVNKTSNSNLFFWLFKSQQGKWEERPLVVWFQGGPGASSTFGLFSEVGPFSLGTDQTLGRREYAWNQEYNLVFFDNPVGTGFSFTELDFGYARNENDVGRDLYSAFVQLYKLFPALQNNSLIIAGESYAGKYIPATAYEIHKMNKISPFQIKVAGLMMGNALSDPGSMLNYASYLYNLGLIDKNTKDELARKEDETRASIRAGKYLEAYGEREDEFDEIDKVTGFRHLYDFIHNNVSLSRPEVSFVGGPEIRKAIHVGSHPFKMGREVKQYVLNDRMQSVKPWVEELLTAEEYPIMYYSGQLDIIDAYPLSASFYNSLQWPRAKEYHEAGRCQFIVDCEVAGYYKSAGTFIEVLVRNAGHMVPIAQPKWAYKLLDTFVKNSAFFKDCHKNSTCDN